MFSYKEALGAGWKLAKKHLGLLWFLLLISGAISFLSDALDGAAWNPWAVFFAGLGMAYIFLRLHDGKGARFLDLFSQYRLVFRNFAASVLFAIGVAGPFVATAFFGYERLNGQYFFPVPGDDPVLIIFFSLSLAWAAYVGTRYQFYNYLIVDKDLDIVESLQESARMTKGRTWKLIGFSLALVGLNILGALALVVGLLATVPMSVMAYVYVYRKLSPAEDGAVEEVGASESVRATESPAPSLEDGISKKKSSSKGSGSLVKIESQESKAPADAPEAPSSKPSSPSPFLGDLK
jgi:hypothetical protein